MQEKNGSQKILIPNLIVFTQKSKSFSNSKKTSFCESNSKKLFCEYLNNTGRADFDRS